MSTHWWLAEFGAKDAVAGALPATLAVLMLLSVIGVAIAGVWGMINWIRAPSYAEMIENWCLARRMQVVHLDRRYLWKGPFFLSPNGTAVFYVTACDALGTTKHLWARCGHSLFGMMMPELRVIPAD